MADTKFFKSAAYFNSYVERNPPISVYPSFLSFVLDVKVILIIIPSGQVLCHRLARATAVLTGENFRPAYLKSNEGSLTVFTLLLMTLGCFDNQFNLSVHLYPIGRITYENAQLIIRGV